MVENLNNLISGHNLAQSCDLIYSEYTSLEQLDKINKDENLIIDSGKNFILFKKKFFKLNENDIIFTNHFFLNDLFKKLNKIDNLKNIKLVTHWSDNEINEKLFNTKPRCISKWYGINVNYEHPDLIPIPLGLAGNYSQKNLIVSSLNNKNELKNKHNLLYINFQKNTNNKERDNILNYFDGKSWVTIKEPTLTLEEYQNDISNSKFVLCPFGNGFDTHRLWEVLYCGSIPIVKQHQTYKTLTSLPVLFISNFEQLNENFLSSKYEEIISKDYSLDKLNVNFWISMIKEIQIESSEKYDVKFSNLELNYIKIKYLISKYFLRYRKKIFFRFNQIKNLFFKFK